MDALSSVDFLNQVGQDGGRAIVISGVRGGGGLETNLNNSNNTKVNINNYRQYRSRSSSTSRLSSSHYQRQNQHEQQVQFQQHDLQPILVRSNSHQYLHQDTSHNTSSSSSSSDVLYHHEDDLLDRLEDEEDDMTPEANNPRRRTSSPPESAANKKSNKPLMEKKRRQRINRCLNDLKTMVLDYLKKDPSRYSKLEKADILEMTVRHLQTLHKQEAAAGRMPGGSRNEDSSKFRAGFKQCAAEITKYLSGMNDIPMDLNNRILNHLNSVCISTSNNVNNNATCVQNSVNVMPNPAPIILVLNSTPANPAPTPIQQISTQPISFHENAGNSMGVQPNFTVITTPKPQNITTQIQPQTQSNGIQILPTRLNNGDLALILPATLPLPTQQHREVQQTPSVNLQSSAPVLTAILTSDRIQNSSSTMVVQPPALSTSSEDSALGAETYDILDSDMSSGISTPMSSMSTASSPLPADEAGRVSPKKATTSRSFSSPKSHHWHSNDFREELISGYSSSSSSSSMASTHRRNPTIAPKPTYPWQPRSNIGDTHKRKKANTPPPEEEVFKPCRPWI